MGWGVTAFLPAPWLQVGPLQVPAERWALKPCVNSLSLWGKQRHWGTRGPSCLEPG